MGDIALRGQGRAMLAKGCGGVMENRRKVTKKY